MYHYPFGVLGIEIKNVGDVKRSVDGCESV